MNLETDQRDDATITLHAAATPLPGLLDEVCQAMCYAWEFDSENESINLYPADTTRHGYYPFGLTIPPVAMQGEDLHEVLGKLMQTPLLAKKYPLLVSLGWSPEVRKRWERFTGTLENMSVRQAFNWICVNHGRNTAWECSYSPDLGLAVFGFVAKYVPKGPKGSAQVRDDWAGYTVARLCRALQELGPIRRREEIPDAANRVRLVRRLNELDGALAGLRPTYRENRAALAAIVRGQLRDDEGAEALMVMLFPEPETPTETWRGCRRVP